MADTVMYRFVVKRDTAANFTAANTLLLQGEFALETDTRKMKIGDGTTAWTALAYLDLAGESIATTSVAGIVKPDGTSITVDSFGVIAAVGGGGWTTKYSNDLSSSITDFHSALGTWAVTGGVLESSDFTAQANRLILTDPIPYAAIRLTVDVQIEASNLGSVAVAGIGVTDDSYTDSSMCDAALRLNSGVAHVVIDQYGIATISDDTYAWGTTGTWITLQVILIGTRMKLRVGGVDVRSVVGPSSWNVMQKFGLFSYGCMAKFRNFTVELLD